MAAGCFGRWRGGGAISAILNFQFSESHLLLWASKHRLRAFSTHDELWTGLKIRVFREWPAQIVVVHRHTIAMSKK